MQSDVLEARTRLLGPEHPDTLAARANLATTLRRSGGIRGGAKTAVRGLGGEHAAAGRRASRHSGSELPIWRPPLRALGEYEEARKLQSEVLEASTRLLGAEHPDTLTAKANLAASLRALGEYEEARKLVSEVLEARTRLLGAEQPDALWTSEGQSGHPARSGRIRRSAKIGIRGLGSENAAAGCRASRHSGQRG